MKATYVQGEAYIQARKQPDGKWRLYWAGTNNEIFPNELFTSAQEARMYWRAMKIKGLVPA